MATNPIKIELSSDEALVLLKWGTRFNAGNHIAGSHTSDQAEERVLWDLESILETQLAQPLSDDYEKRLSSARERVRDPLD